MGDTAKIGVVAFLAKAMGNKGDGSKMEKIILRCRNCGFTFYDYTSNEIFITCPKCKKLVNKKGDIWRWQS